MIKNHEDALTLLSHNREHASSEKINDRVSKQSRKLRNQQQQQQKSRQRVEETDVVVLHLLGLFANVDICISFSGFFGTMCKSIARLRPIRTPAVLSPQAIAFPSRRQPATEPTFLQRKHKVQLAKASGKNSWSCAAGQKQSKTESCETRCSGCAAFSSNTSCQG